VTAAPGESLAKGSGDPNPQRFRIASCRQSRPTQRPAEDAHRSRDEGDRDTEPDEDRDCHRRAERLNESDAREAECHQPGRDHEPGREDDRDHLRRRSGCRVARRLA